MDTKRLIDYLALDYYLKNCVDKKSSNMLLIYSYNSHAKNGFDEYRNKLEKNDIKYLFNIHTLTIVVDNSYIYFRTKNDYNKIKGLRFKEYHYQ